MTSVEENNDDWKELRSRVDSIANAIFLVAGGALSLSITVVLGNKSASYLTKNVLCLNKSAWYCLLASILLFLLLKLYLVWLAYLRQVNGDFLNRHLSRLNHVAWIIGLLGFISFVLGMIAMVQSAVAAIST
jgi:hypothetical protein